MSEKDRILHSGLIEQYVLGLLEEEEILEVESYLQRYPELRKHKEAIEKSMELILMQNAIVPPPNTLKQEFESNDNTSNEKHNSSSLSNNNRWVLSLASSLVLLSAAITFLFYQGRRDAEVKLVSLESQYEALETTCKRLQAQHEGWEKEQHLIKNSHRVVLKGTPLAPNAVALVYWNNHEKIAYLDALNLPLTPENKEYQLWADVDGVMVNIGTFDETKGALQMVNYVPHAESLNVTLEPKRQ
ncbi:MAG: anti-sigma factor [Saprospiraceae bacterium]|nr:anti-sigma factor [Saprospiraceae bacterium]